MKKTHEKYLTEYTPGWNKFDSPNMRTLAHKMSNPYWAIEKAEEIVEEFIKANKNELSPKVLKLLKSAEKSLFLAGSALSRGE